MPDPEPEQENHQHEFRQDLNSYLLDSLKGIGQAALQLNIRTSLVILLALFVGGWKVGLFATIGTLVGTGTSVAFGIDRKIEDKGVEGFNGALVAIAMVTFLGQNSFSSSARDGGPVYRP